MKTTGHPINPNPMLYPKTESLKEFDGIICDALAKTMFHLKWNPSRFEDEIVQSFRSEIDHTRTRLGQAMHHVDLALKGYGDSISRCELSFKEFRDRPREFTDEQIRDRYVKEIAAGYELFDSRSDEWVYFPRESTIDITIERSPESDFKPAVHVWANDLATGKKLEYIDPEFTQRDYRASYYTEPDPDAIKKIEYNSKAVNWKAVAGAGGKASGKLAAYKLHHHYRPLHSPMGRSLGGHWKALDGQWYDFNQIQQESNAFKKGSLKTSKHWAQVRGTKLAQPWKYASKVCFWVSVGVSVAKIADALNRNDSNQDAVFLKNTLDITFSVIAFVPGVGWAISATYFLTDVSGGFGNWGQASGYSAEQIQTILAERTARDRELLSEMNFNIPYIAPIEQKASESRREMRRFARDKMYVIPRPVFEHRYVK